MTQHQKTTAPASPSVDKIGTGSRKAKDAAAKLADALTKDAEAEAKSRANLKAKTKVIQICHCGECGCPIGDPFIEIEVPVGFDPAGYPGYRIETALFFFREGD